MRGRVWPNLSFIKLVDAILGVPPTNGESRALLRRACCTESVRVSAGGGEINECRCLFSFLAPTPCTSFAAPRSITRPLESAWPSVCLPAGAACTCAPDEIPQASSLYRLPILCSSPAGLKSSCSLQPAPAWESDLPVSCQHLAVL